MANTGCEHERAFDDPPHVIEWYKEDTHFMVDCCFKCGCLYWHTDSEKYKPRVIMLGGDHADDSDPQ
jgi:hypothetical protein